MCKPYYLPMAVFITYKGRVRIPAGWRQTSIGYLQAWQRVWIQDYQEQIQAVVKADLELRGYLLLRPRLWGDGWCISLPKNLNHAILFTWKEIDQYHSILTRDCCTIDPPPSPTLSTSGIRKLVFTPPIYSYQLNENIIFNWLWITLLRQ